MGMVEHSYREKGIGELKITAESIKAKNDMVGRLEALGLKDRAERESRLTAMMMMEELYHHISLPEWVSLKGRLKREVSLDCYEQDLPNGLVEELEYLKERVQVRYTLRILYNDGFGDALIIATIDDGHIYSIYGWKEATKVTPKRRGLFRRRNREPVSDTF